MVWYSYPANFSNSTEVNGLGSFIVYINYTLNGYLGAGFILLIWLLTFGFSLTAGSRKALAVSSFISFIFSIYFLRLGIINIVIPIILIVLTIIGSLGGKEESNY